MTVLIVPETRTVTRLTSALTIPRPLDETFAFFADARNLEQITPPWLNFQIRSGIDDDGRTYEGQLIEYQLSLHGIPIRWRTEIQRFDAPHSFVDRQLRGPYRNWEHTHSFLQSTVDPNATEMFDTVRYRVPGGRLTAPLIDNLLVRRDVRRIFEWRETQILDLLS